MKNTFRSSQQYSSVLTRKTAESIACTLLYCTIPAVLLDIIISSQAPGLAKVAEISSQGSHNLTGVWLGNGH